MSVSSTFRSPSEAEKKKAFLDVLLTCSRAALFQSRKKSICYKFIYLSRSAERLVFIPQSFQKLGESLKLSAYKTPSSREDEKVSEEQEKHTRSCFNADVVGSGMMRPDLAKADALEKS